MNRLRLNRLLISLLALALAFLVFYPAKQTSKKFENDELPESDYFMKLVTINQYDPTGKKTSQLQTAKLERFNVMDLSTIDSPKIVFNQPSGHQWQVISDKGLLENSNQVISLFDNIEISESLPQQNYSSKIAAQDFVINLIDSTAVSNLAVNIFTPQTTTTSDGMTINFESNQLELLSNVKSSGVINNDLHNEPSTQN